MQAELTEMLRRRGFLWPSFEIYGGVSGFYDFGPLGSLLRDNLIRKWKDLYIREEGYLPLETPTIVPFEVLKASGHVDHFTDLMGECSSCRESFRMSELMKEKGIEIEGLPKEEVEKIVKERGVKCPACGGELTLSDFNIMFSTFIGPGSSRRAGFMRPETAQQIFIAFRRVFRHARGKLPLGVVTVGKGYRNEISPRQGVIRLREFTMAEAEVFFDPEHPNPPEFQKIENEKLKLLRASGELVETTAREAVKNHFVCNEMMAYHLSLAKRFLLSIGLREENLRFREQKPGERAHYSSETWDLEVLTQQFGWVEVAGIAYRTDYDLSRHSSYSKTDLSVTINGRKFFPHVVEPSFGIDRILYCVLEHSYALDGKRRFLKLKPDLAPIQVGVFPLMPKEELSRKAQQIYRMLKTHFSVIYDESGSIGRRYLRADEVGVPYCVTIDYQTLADESVTIRDRDTTKQIRINKEGLVQTLSGLLSGELKFEEAGPAFCSEEEEKKETYEREQENSQ
jgi:glycyl-tRNA synthetase